MDIKKLIDTDYLTEIRNNRRGNGQLGKLNKKTQEFFTPYSIVKKMGDKVPEEDWSDDRVKTDEGLLEVCGCPKGKCKEYAEYCKNTIDKVFQK